MWPTKTNNYSRLLSLNRKRFFYICIKAIWNKNVPYKWSPLSIFAPEGHLDSVLVPRPLVKGLAGLERGAVQVQAGCALRVADIFHTMQADGVWTHEQENI